MKTHFIVGDDITEFDETFDKLMLRQYPTSPKPFEFVGVPFCDGIIVPKCPRLFATQEEFKRFANSYVSVYSIKSHRDRYFVRINDNNAAMTQDLTQALRRMFVDLRRRIDDLPQASTIPGAESESHDYFLFQLDIAQDLKGCVYSNDISFHKK